MALVKEYFELTKKYQNEYGENTIVLMQVGSFMECYGLIDKNTNNITGSKIQDFTRICELNIAEKNICIGKDKSKNYNWDYKIYDGEKELHPSEI